MKLNLLLVFLLLFASCATRIYVADMANAPAFSGAHEMNVSGSVKL